MQQYKHDNIMALATKHPNAIAIFGGVYHANDICDILSMIPEVIEHAHFYHWHESMVDTLRTFCRLCVIDARLVEAACGMTFDEMVAKYVKN